MLGKYWKIYIVLFLFAVPFISFILIVTGTMPITILCFSVDSAERLYIGFAEEICVYEDAVKIHSFSSPTSRAYVFTITEDGEILLATTTCVYQLDLQGNVKDMTQNPSGEVYRTLKHQASRFTTEEGDTYRIQSSLWWPRIIKNNTEVVYRISSVAFAAKMVAFLGFVSWPFAVIRMYKTSKTGDGSLS